MPGSPSDDSPARSPTCCVAANRPGLPLEPAGNGAPTVGSAGKRRPSAAKRARRGPCGWAMQCPRAATPSRRAGGHGKQARSRPERAPPSDRGHVKRAPAPARTHQATAATAEQPPVARARKSRQGPQPRGVGPFARPAEPRGPGAGASRPLAQPPGLHPREPRLVGGAWQRRQGPVGRTTQACSRRSGEPARPEGTSGRQPRATQPLIAPTPGPSAGSS
jgi:hypothetical protein